MHKQIGVQESVTEGEARRRSQELPTAEGELLSDFARVGDSGGVRPCPALSFVSEEARVHSEFTSFRKSLADVNANSKFA